MTGTLFVVATPLGNLEDLSPRALRTLGEVDLIACEDTRRTGKLLAHFGISVRTVSFHEHNEESRAGAILQQLLESKNVALVSDAGTPLISDPGYRLVRLCREAGIAVCPVPGPCAAVATLSAAGLPTDQFLFAGFAARKPAALRKQLEKLSAVECTMVFYLSPHRLKETLAEFARAFGQRKACLVRELTKLHESWSLGSLDGLAEEAQSESPRGEYTLAVEGGDSNVPVAPQVDVAAYVAGLQSQRGLSRSQAVRLAAHQLGFPRQHVYRQLDENP